MRQRRHIRELRPARLGWVDKALQAFAVLSALAGRDPDDIGRQATELGRKGRKLRESIEQAAREAEAQARRGQ